MMAVQCGRDEYKKFNSPDASKDYCEALILEITASSGKAVDGFDPRVCA
jgi:hypothetical protein